MRFRNALKNVKNEVPADSDDEWGNDSKFVKESDDEDPEPPAYIRDIRVAFGDLVSPPPGW